MLCRCNYLYSYLYLNISFDPTVYGLVYGYSSITLISSGADPWTPGSLTGTLSVTLQNSGNVTGQFTVTPNGCSGSGNPAVSGGAIGASVGASTSADFSFAVSE